MRILLTGAGGFLGWHTRVRLRALTGHDVVPVTRASWAQLPELVAGVDAVLHVAGVNRAAPEAVEGGNRTLAEDLATALRAAGTRPRAVVFANSIQSGNDTAYGAGKAAAARILAAAAAELDARFVDVRLPNLFGEHGRPRYNSFVQTFAHGVVAGEKLPLRDRPVTLLHAQDAAQVLIDALTRGSGLIEPAGTPTTVAEVLDTLRSFNALYASGDIPPLWRPLDVDLFNTLRAARFPDHYPIGLTVRADQRGRLVETVRAHGGQGQTFVSTTEPGCTRGEHFHLCKIERFVVLSGQARISLRRLFSTEVVSFVVSGREPCVVDMPTLWAHNITNTGDNELTTLFWTHELFDADRPDTYPEPVAEAILAGVAR